MLLAMLHQLLMMSWKKFAYVYRHETRRQEAHKDDSREGFAFVNRRSNVDPSKKVTGYVTSIIDDEQKEAHKCIQNERKSQEAHKDDSGEGFAL